MLGSIVLSEHVVRHTVVGLLSALFCFWVAHSAWIRRGEARHLFTLWAAAFGSTALFEAMHAISAHVGSGLVDHWLPWSGIVAHTNLVALVALAWFANIHRYTDRELVARVTIWLLVMFLALLPVVAKNVTVIGTAIDAVNQPFDAALLAAYLVLIGLFWVRPIRRVHLPACIWALLIPGALAHAVMVFWAKEHLDIGTHVASVLKLLEYGLWAAASRLWLRRNLPSEHDLDTRLAGLEHSASQLCRDLTSKSTPKD